ncbi:MAG: sialate O-acetylesterase [Planctomycetota bacterium]
MACSIPTAIRLLTRWSVALLVTVSVQAQLDLPPQLSDGMVVQRDQPIPVWGRGTPGGQVSVMLGDDVHRTTIDSAGSWSVELDVRPAGGPLVLAVESGGVRIDINDVLVGDVWLCSGQSNMQWPLRQTSRFEVDGPTMIDDRLRLFTVDRRVAPEPVPDLVGKQRWSAATPESMASFSGVSAYFGLELRREVGIPIGLVHSSWGGTRAESWTPRADIEAGPPMVAALMDHWALRLPEVTGEVTLEQPGSLYNAMIHPLRRQPIAGVIWYQGEANAARAGQYRDLLPTLIDSWRRIFDDPGLPFGIVQLANFMRPASEPEDTPWARLRDAQLHAAQTVPGVGLVCAIDIGDANDIHPRNKRDVGLRLARWALADVYGIDVVPSGPVAADHAIEGDQMRIVFEHADALQTTDGEAPLSFTIAGEDRVFHNASARIEGRSVVVRSDAVKAPVAVRYAWANNPRVNLVNGEALPAVPFRTDDWPGVTSERTHP